MAIHNKQMLSKEQRDGYRRMVLDYTRSEVHTISEIATLIGEDYSRAQSLVKTMRKEGDALENIVSEDKARSIRSMKVTRQMAVRHDLTDIAPGDYIWMDGHFARLTAIDAELRYAKGVNPNLPSCKYNCDMEKLSPIELTDTVLDSMLERAHSEPQEPVAWKVGGDIYIVKTPVSYQVEGVNVRALHEAQHILRLFNADI